MAALKEADGLELGAEALTRYGLSVQAVDQAVTVSATTERTGEQDANPTPDRLDRGAADGQDTTTAPDLTGVLSRWEALQRELWTLGETARRMPSDSIERRAVLGVADHVLSDLAETIRSVLGDELGEQYLSETVRSVLGEGASVLEQYQYADDEEQRRYEYEMADDDPDVHPDDYDHPADAHGVSRGEP